MTAQKISQKFFDKHSNTWDDNISEEKIVRIENIFRDKINNVREPVLDMGSGTGILIPIFNQFEISNNSIIELDISAKMLKCAREKYDYLYNVKYVQADGHFLPFMHNYFNTVICFQVYPHFQDKIKVTREIYSALNNNGKLIILHLMGHKELNDMHRRAGDAVEKDRILPAEKLADLLESEGFTIKLIEENPNLYLIISEKN